MILRDLITHLEDVAPPVYQEAYDNAGLITGSPEMEVTGVLVCLDSTEAVIAEAVKNNCNVVVAHHPIVFKGLKQLTGRNYVERVIIDAIRAGVAIYAIHTNLDNVLHQGVNGKIAERLGLEQSRILSPRKNLMRLSALVPASQLKECRSALLKAGIQEVFSHRVQFEESGTEVNSLVNGVELRLSVLLTVADQRQALSILKQYSDRKSLSCELTQVENYNSKVGSGLIGLLPEPVPEKEFLAFLKKQMQTSCVRHTALLDKPIRRVALCGGAGGFLLKQAIRQKADIFITGDYKYHEFFDADRKIIIADIGHYESEQFTIELLSGIISKKFRNFAVHSTQVNTNPVNYFMG